MSGVRHPDREMMKSWSNFDTSVKLAKQANTAGKIARFKGLLEALQTTYYRFNEDFNFYKEDIIRKICKTEEAFNALVDVEDGTDDGESAPAFPQNDAWCEAQLLKYVETRDLLEDRLDKEVEDATEAEEIKPATLDVNMVVEEYKADCSRVQASISKLKAEIENHADRDMAANVAMTYDGLISKLQAKIDQDIKERVTMKLALTDDATDPEFTNAKLIANYGTFSQQQSIELDSCSMILARKHIPRTEEVKPIVESRDGTDRPALGKPREQVYLEKTKPPRFNGDELEFPEFQRKWNSQVHKANLPVETELDKLRDVIPKDAKDQLYGVTKLDEAWSILGKRYGNKMLISKKLKNQLKGIQSEGKSDPEKVINLKIKVRNIVTRLEALDMGDALKYDSEFLSGVYCALPDRHRVRWLDATKTGDRWADMLAFLDKAYEQSNEELALLSTLSRDNVVKKVVKPAGLAVGAAGGGLHDDEEDDDRQREFKKRARETCGNCPVCARPHTYKRRDASIWPSDRLLKCRKFSDMNVKQRAAMIEKVKGCGRCTSWSHQKRDCRMPANSCGEDISGSRCTGDHSRLVHGSGNVYCGVARSKLMYEATFPTNLGLDSSDPFSIVQEEEEALYFLQDIPLKNSSTLSRSLWDKGSNRVLIREAFAEANNLVSRDVTYKMEVVGGNSFEIIHSKIYLLDLLDMHGNTRTLWGYGVQRIMSSGVPNLSSIRKMFPHIPEEAFMELEPKEVDVLIGLNMMELQPAGGLGMDKVGGLTALRSLFGCGWGVGGHHSDIRPCGIQTMTSAAVVLRIAKICISPEPSHTPEFWEAESMGVLPPPRCDSCRGCMKTGPCSERHFQHGVKKQAELDLIKSKTRIINGEVWCDYPFLRDPACLPYNRKNVVRVAEKVEQGLVKDGLHAVYCDQIRQFLERGVAVKLSQEEMASWTGPAQYITHHAVLKDSVTTPVRVVTNSSFGNGGSSLNACLASGPNSLNPMLDVMLRFRCWLIAFQIDLAKAYNTLRTWLLERHLRRFVWRMSPSEDWQDYALDRVHFGDACAATQLEVAKDMIADLGAAIDPEAARRIHDDMYVDDGLTGGDEQQVARFVGVKQEDGSYNGTFSRIMALGNFKIKAFAVSGQVSTAESDLMGNKVLGYDSDIERDMLALTFRMNISKKKRSVRVDPDLTLKDVDKLKSANLSKRVLLGVTNGFGDFLGMGTPHTIKFKALMRELFLLEDPLGWDDPVPEEARQQWVDLMVETLECPVLPFPRSTRPPNAVPGLGPSVVGFSDYGKIAYEARVYLRWQLAESTELYCARLAICKAKVPPLRGLTVPRGELCALTLLSRLVLSVVIALQKLDHRPVSAVMLVDSKCSISALQTKRALLPFFQNRVAETKENMEQVAKFCPMEEVHYVETGLNPSDMSTRATAKMSALGPDSFHQSGPEFISLPWEEWPVSREFSASELPSDEFIVRDKPVFSAAIRANFCLRKVHPKNPWTAIEELLFYSDDIRKVLRILARYLRGLEAGFRKSQEMSIDNVVAFKLVAADPKKRELERAEQLLLLHAMVQTQEAQAAGKLASLLPCRVGKIIVTRGRLGEKSLHRLLGVSSLPILMPSCRVAYLYMVEAHTGEHGLVHRSIVSTLARSRKKVWIVRGRNLAKKVVNACPRCDLDRKETLLQQMADIKEEQLTLAPPWTNISLDFAGPYLVKGEVNKRARMKVWVLVYCCRATRAVCLLICAGYSTADFLLTHAEFVYRKGRPSSIVSDRGSQLVAAGKVVAGKMNWDQVVGKNSMSEWIFVPAGAQHRNGISEATVKVMKKSLALAMFPGAMLTYAEMSTLLAKVTYSVNSRPLTLQAISPNSQQEDNMLPITPNHILLGRGTIDVPPMEYDEDSNFSARLRYVQEVYKTWWEKWIQDVLPTLVPCRRWKTVQKNLRVGDVVMMKYEGNIQDDYRRARVKEVFPDQKGLIRTAKVVFRKRDRREKPEAYWKKPLCEQVVAVQRLAVLQAAGEPLATGGPEDQLPLDVTVRAALARVTVNRWRCLKGV